MEAVTFCDAGRPRRATRSLGLLVMALCCGHPLVMRAAEPGERATPEPIPVATLRATIQRSLPFIEERGAWWMEHKKCVSCHRGGTMVWSLSAAEASGFTVSDQLAQWRNWTVDASLKTNDKGKVVGTGNLEGLAQLVVEGSKRPERAEDYAALVKLMVTGQQENGLWRAGGQLPSQKRPKMETQEVSTMWIAWALAQVAAAPADRPGAAASARRALQRIEQAAPGISTEWFATRLLVAHELGNSAEVARWREALLSKQHGDGGWGWLVADPSDALATGLSLYALGRTSTEEDSKDDEAAIGTARHFLVATQRENGSWQVKGTKANKRGKVEETAVFWGTTWATLGLLETLPQQVE